MKFKISRSIKAGKLYYIARSLAGSIRRDNLKELEGAIEDFNEREKKGQIKVKVSAGSGGTGKPEEEIGNEIVILNPEVGGESGKGTKAAEGEKTGEKVEGGTPPSENKKTVNKRVRTSRITEAKKEKSRTSKFFGYNSR